MHKMKFEQLTGSATKPSGAPLHGSNAQLPSVVGTQLLTIGSKAVPGSHSCGISTPLIHKIQFLHDVSLGT